MKKALLCMMAVLLMLPLMMKAQTEITVGTATTTSSTYPFYHCYEDSWVQSVYPATLINTAGTITEIAFNCSTSGSQTFNSLHIYLGTTSSSGSSSFIATTQLTEVYSGTNVAVGATTGWQTFTLTAPFVYDGQSNLVVVVAKDQSSWDCSVAYNGFYGTDSYASIIGYCDGTPGCAQSPSNCDNDDYDNFLPQIKLSITTAPITCPAPTALAVASVNDNSADLTWTAGDSESAWDIYVASSLTDVPDSSTVPTYTSTTNSYTLTGLTSSTDYKVCVRANCGAGDVSVWRSVTFMTSQLAAILPYSQNFEDTTENAQWTLETTGTNRWYFGTAANNTDQGTLGLYISSDNGATNGYNTGTTTNTWAYRDIDFGNTYAEYNISFDYKAYGESCCDYVKVYVGQPAVPSGNSAPSGATQLGGNMNMQSNWTHVSYTVNSSFAGVQRLYFLWHNDGSVGTSPSGAIDNISITGTNCGRPYALTLDSTTQTTVAFQFTPALATDGAWQYVIVAHGDTIDESQAIAITATSYEITGLTADTPYDIYVRTDCGGEYSFWTSALQVRTECPQYMAIPYTESFDTYGAGSTSYFPSCWTRKYTTSSTYPYISASTPSSTPGCLYFYSDSSSSTYSCAIAPEVDTNTYPINTLTVGFKIKKTSTSSGYGALEVGIMSDPDDISTFTAVQTYSGSEWAATNTWYEVEVPFTTFTGNGSYIALRKPGTASYYTYVDDFSVYPTPTCLKPMSVTLSQITDNSVTVAWNARSGESEWQIAVVPAGSNVSTATPETVYTNPATISNLTDNTQYDVYVKAICGGSDESPWSAAATFYTRCLPTDVIPFVESFDTYGAGGTSYYPNCWVRMTNNTTSYPYISSTHYDGVGSLYFYSSSSYYALAASQALDLSTYTANSLMLTFKAKATSTSYGRLDVGVMTDASNLNTMTVLKSIYPTDFSSTSAWETFDVVLPAAYTTGNVYLAFLAPQGGTNYVYVDSVALINAPTCMDPTNLEISNVAGASAQLSWDAPAIAPASYTVEYSEANQDNWTIASASVTGTSYIVTGLEQQTAYDVRVTSNCDDGTPTPIMETFMTGCLAGGDIAIGTGTSTSYNIPVNNFYRYTYSQQIFLASEMGGANELSSVSFEYGYSSPTTSKSNCVIYLGQTTQSSFNSTSDYIPLTSLTQVYSGPLNCQQGWNTFTFDSVFHYDGTSNLVLVVDDNSYAYNGSSYVFKVHTASPNRTIYFYSDSYNPDPANLSSFSGSNTTSTNRNNVKFGGLCDSTITCVAPVAQIADVDDESITVSWVPGYTETSWELEYKSDNSASWTQEGSVTTSPYIISNLAANTGYSVRMRSDCGGEYSDWVTLTATTECSSIDSLPYVQNFESATGSGASYFINCWRRGTNYSTSYPYTSSSQHHGGNYSLYFYGTSSYYSYAATPRFGDDIDMDNLQIAFYGYKTSASYNIEVGIMTDPTDYSTFQLLGSFSPSTTSTWELAEINTENYTGTGRYVAFRVPQSFSDYFYIDDIDIHEIPFCGRVTNITASQITTTTAHISWTPGGNEDAWEVLYGPSGTVDLVNDTPIQTSTASVDLTNLSPSTAYDVYVRIDCGGGEYGAWTQEDFRSACGQITQLPFTEGFDNYTASSSSRPDCWSFPITYSNAPYVTSNYSHTGGKSLFFQSLTTSPTTAVTPQLDLDIHTLRVHFWLKAESTTSSGTFDVGVMSNATNASTFESVQVIQPTSTNWTEYWVSFDSTTLTGNGNYIAFRQHSNSSIWYYWLDDVEVGIIPSCTAPTNLTYTNLTSTSVDLGWTDEATESSWQMYYYPTTATPNFNDAVTVSTNSYSATNLTPATTYNVYVRTECSSGNGYSDYLVGSFTTLCEPISTLPYNMNFDNVTGSTTTSVSVNNLPVCWSSYNNGTVSSYTGYPMVYNSSSYAASGSNSVRFYVYSSTYGDQYAILPPVDETTYPLNSVALQFSARPLSTSYPFILEVGVMTNPMDPTTFQLMGTYTFTGSTYQTQECYFDAFTGTSGQIAVRARYAAANNINYGYMDNVIIKVAPTCRKPMNVSIASVTSTDANITWAAQAGSSFNIAIGSTANFDPTTATNLFTSSTTSYQATGLTSNTTYYVKVQTDCGTEMSEWTDAVAFLTAANAATVPYTTTFGDTTDAADWVFFNGSQTNKWYIGLPSGTTDSALYISSDNGASNTYDNYSTSNVWACRDISFGNFAEYNLAVNWKAYGESCCDYLKIYIGDPAIVTAGSVTPPTGAVQLGGTMNMSSSYATFTTTLNSTYANTTKRLYFLWHNDGSVGITPPANIDSISLTGANCGRPYGVASSNVTAHTADITFNAAAATDAAWEYALCTTINNPNDASVTPVAITDTIINLTGLTSATAHHIYVRTDCGGGDYSAWSNVCNFTTLISCPAPTAVTATGTTTSQTTIGWTENGTATDWVIEYGPAGFTPGTGTTVNVTTNPYTLTGLTTATNYTVYVKADCGGGDQSTTASLTFATECDVITTFPYTQGFESAGTMPACWSNSYVSGSTNWGFQAGSYSSYGSVTTAHTGSYNAYFFNTSGNTTKLVSPVFDLTQVTSPYVSYWYSQEAWGGDQDQLKVYYRTSSTGAWTLLTSHTNSVSTWTFDSLALPSPSATYQLAFEGYGDYGYGITLDDITVSGQGATPPTPTACDDPTNLTASNISQTSADIQWTAGGTETSWNLQYKAASASTWSSSIVVSNTASYTLAGLTANTAYNVRVQADCGSGNTSNWVTANFTTLAEVPQDCPAPTNLNAFNITQTSANIQWTAGGTETSWNLQYKAASASNWSSTIAVSTTPTYAITGLTANTAYNVRVQTVCSATETSSWVTANFTTLAEEQQDCPEPTNFRATEVTQNSVTLAWDQQAGTANEWEINYKAAAAETWTNITVTTNPYTITDLTPNTAYQAQILAHCVNGVNSDATEVITFTTQPDGINDYVLDNNTVLYPNPTTGLVTIRNEECGMRNVNVYDVYGKLIATVNANGNIVTLDATSFAAGIYFAQIETEKGVVTKRFVKK